MVDGCKRRQFCQEAFEKSRGKRLYGCGNWGLVREYHVLSNLGVGGKETPVDIGAIADVWVVILCGGVLEDLLDKCLGLIVLRFFEKELDDCGKDL